MFCHVGENQVIGVHDVSSLYHVPLLLESQGVVYFLTKRLEIPLPGRVSRHMLEHAQSLSRRWRDMTRVYVA